MKEDEWGELPHTAHTPLVRDLAALKVPGAQPREMNAHNLLQPLNQRDPAQETLLFDADPVAQNIVDTAASGFSMTVTAAPGTEPLRTAVNIASTLMGRGKSVLVVGEKRSTLASLASFWDAPGLTICATICWQNTLPKISEPSLFALSCVTRIPQSLIPQILIVS